MRLRQKILTYILAIVIFYAFYFWGIPSIISIDKRINFIESTVKKTLGYNIELKNPKIKMGMLPSIWIKADEFNILNSDKSHALTLKKPILKVSILPFIFGKCDLHYFSADSLLANLSLDKDLKLYLGQYYIDKNQKSQIDINHLKLNIQDYKINMIDKSFNKKIYLKGDFITIDEFTKNKSIKMATNAILTVNGSKSIINFDLNMKLPFTKNLSDNHAMFIGTITNLDFSYLSKYIAYFSNKKLSDVKGVLNLEARTDKISNKNNEYQLNFTLEKFGVDGKEFVLPYYYKDKIEFTSNISAIGKDLKINSASLKAPKVNVLLSGNINKVTSNSPELGLILEILNTRAEGIVALLPANNKLYNGLEFDIETLVKTGFFADVYSKLNIKGPYTTPEVYGDLKITNAYVTPHPISNGATKATINLTFVNDRLNMDVLVPCAKTEFVKVTGFTKLYGEKLSDILIQSSKNVDLSLAQKILMPLHKVLNFELGPVPIMSIKGFGNINLRVIGNKIKPSAFGVFNFNRGTVSFIDVHNMTITNASGTLKFDNKNTTFKSKSAFLNSKPISISGTCSLYGDMNFDVFTEKQQVQDLSTIIETSPMLEDISRFVNSIKNTKGETDFKLNLSGKVKNATDIKLGKNILAKGDLKLYNVSAFIDGLKLPITKISGDINFNNLDLNVNLESLINKSKLKIQGTIKNNIAQINMNSENLTPEDLLLYFGNSKFSVSKNKQNKGRIIASANYNGPLDKVDFKKIKVNASANFNDFKFYYIPKKIPIEILSGNIIIKNDVLSLNNINSRVGGMPLFVRGSANNIYNTPDFNIYINAKPNQNFADTVFNRSEIYPIKFKGDINASINLKGKFDEFNLKSSVKLSEVAKIYYMGSTIGDESRPTTLNLDAIMKKENIFIKLFSLDRMIASQNNRLYPQRELTVSGGINYKNNDILFNDFKIKTLTPTDSRIFNIIFKKPFIKQGIFNSDIKINGSVSAPNIYGTLVISDIDIPRYFININNVNFDFQNNNISVNSTGQIFGKNFKIKSIMQNRLKPPYVLEDLNIFVSDININEILKNLKFLNIDNEKKLSKNTISPIDLNSFIIKKSNFQTDTIELDNILIHDFFAKLYLTENNILKLEEVQLKTAQGEIKGNYQFNLNDYKHSAVLKLSDINADLFSSTLFNFRNQIYGNVNGTVEVSCIGNTHEKCLRTLSGNGGFNMENGKMPRLGSLEYLLNAANLVKSGVTGLSINSLIDLITPLRTGEFDSITGSFNIKNGVANNIQIFSTGKSLNLFITGNYNLDTMIAKMSIFGRLSKNASSILGPIGSASLNALFNSIPGLNLADVQNNYLLDSINKIPGIELTNKKYRIFTVDINGDINSDNYVKSFKWVE